MASLRSFNTTRMRDLITCSVCLEVLENPKVLPCLHSYCSQCLLGMWTPWQIKLTCPVCKDTSHMPLTGVKGLPSDFKAEQLKELLEIEPEDRSGGRAGEEMFGAVQQSDCEVCKAEVATLHCAQCSVYYCKKCIRKHESSPLFKSHQVAELIPEEASQGLGASFCTYHRGHRIQFLCTTCSPHATLCPICVLQHNVTNHDMCDIRDAVAHFRQKLRKDLKSVQTTMALLHTHKGAIEDRKEIQTKLLSDLHEAICLQALLVVAKVEDTKARMLEDLQTMVISLVSDINEEQLDDQLNELTCLEAELLKAVNSTNHSSLISSHGKLHQRLLLLNKLNLSEEPITKKSIRFVPNKKELDHDIVGTLELFGEVEYNRRSTVSDTDSSIVKTERSEVVTRSPDVTGQRARLIRRMPGTEAEREERMKKGREDEDSEIQEEVEECGLGGVGRGCGRRRGGQCESCEQRSAAVISFYSKKKERIQKLCRHCRALSDVREDMK